MWSQGRAKVWTAAERRRRRRRQSGSGGKRVIRRTLWAALALYEALRADSIAPRPPAAEVDKRQGATPDAIQMR